MTQQQLALKLNVTDGAISKWETNKSNPDYDILKNICKVFNVKTSYFFDDLSLKEKIVIKLKELKSLFKKYWYILLFLIAFLFLLIYFISTINSFQMYELVIEDDKIMIDSSYYIKTKNKAVLDINNINILLDDTNVIKRKIKLYTFVNNRKTYFYESDNLDSISINSFVGYDEFIDKKITKMITKGLYFEIVDINKNDKSVSKHYKISLVKTYDSRWLFKKINTFKNNNFEVIESNTKIDSYTLVNLGFKQIDETNTYYKQLKNYKIYVDLNDEKIYYTVDKNNIHDKYDYFYNKNLLYYTKINNKLKDDTKIIKKFSYNKRNEAIVCVLGNCKDYKKIYESFMREIQDIFGKFSKSQS